MYVWNDVQVSEAAELHGVPRGRVVATGAAKFDEWFERRPRATREELARAGRARPRAARTCSTSARRRSSPRTRSASSASWLERLRADERPGAPRRSACSSGRTRRTPPSGATPTSPSAANVAVWPRAGAQPDAGDARAEFFDSLAHSAAVVGINTSALLEAAILGKSVLVPLVPQFAGTQQGTLHFRYLLHENGGFLHVAATLDEHADQLAAALEQGDDRPQQTRRFVESFLRPRGLDRPAAPILGGELEQLALVRPEPAHTTAARWRFALALTPLAAGGVAIGGLAEKIRAGKPAVEPEPT